MRRSNVCGPRTGGVSGTSQRGLRYDASMPDLAAWVHNTLTESFLTAYRQFGPEPLQEAEADRFVIEQSRVGAMLGAAPLPSTAAELHAWVSHHRDAAPSAGMRSAVSFLRRPPLPGTSTARLQRSVAGGCEHHAVETRRDPGTSRPPRSAGRHRGAVEVPALRSAQQPLMASRAGPLRAPHTTPPSSATHSPPPPESERGLIGSLSRRSAVTPALVRCAHGPLGPRPRAVWAVSSHQFARPLSPERPVDLGSVGTWWTPPQAQGSRTRTLSP